MSSHEGHRQRLKNRFRREGLENFEEVYVLELLLFYCVPRRDTRPLAEALLEQYGSLSQVLEAPAKELEKIPGIGAEVSTFLSLITAAGRYYLVNRSSNNVILSTTEKCGTYLQNYFYGLQNEQVYLLCLDAKCKVLWCGKVADGSVNSAAVSSRKIVEMALRVNATTVVLAHNHPSGLAIPSPEDVLTTRRGGGALQAVEITLADHIIVAEGDFVSLAQSGMYRPEDCCVVL